MEVTSIRLEPELKEKLKELSGEMGYQSLIRDILWRYVEKHSHRSDRLASADIRVSMAATAQRPEICAITGQKIAPAEPMLLGLTDGGELVPLSIHSLAA